MSMIRKENVNRTELRRFPESGKDAATTQSCDLGVLIVCYTASRGYNCIAFRRENDYYTSSMCGHFNVWSSRRKIIQIKDHEPKRNPQTI
jgi:hypothetical protein